MKLTLTLVVFLAAILPASADQTVYQANSTPGNGPSHDIKVFSENLDVMAFGAGSNFPIYEAGHVFPISQGKHHVILGGPYLSRWEKADQWYLEPFVIAKVWSGKIKATAKPYAYFPLNGGKTYVGAEELSVVRKVTPELGVGIEGTFFKSNPGPLEIQYGPTVRFERGDTSVSLRSLSFGKGTHSFRLALGKSF